MQDLPTSPDAISISAAFSAPRWHPEDRRTTPLLDDLWDFGMSFLGHKPSQDLEKV
jgi:hypothetical protein